MWFTLPAVHGLIPKFLWNQWKARSAKSPWVHLVWQYPDPARKAKCHMYIVKLFLKCRHRNRLAIRCHLSCVLLFFIPQIEKLSKNKISLRMNYAFLFITTYSVHISCYLYSKCLNVCFLYQAWLQGFEWFTLVSLQILTQLFGCDWLPTNVSWGKISVKRKNMYHYLMWSG